MDGEVKKIIFQTTSCEIPDVYLVCQQYIMTAIIPSRKLLYIYSYTMSLDKTDWHSLWYTSVYSLNTWRLGVSLPGQYLLWIIWKLL